MRKTKSLALLCLVALLMGVIFSLTSCSEKEFEGLTFDSATVMYDGFDHKIEVKGVPEKATLTYSPSNVFSEAGTHVVTATVSQKNYKTATLVATLNIVYPEDYALDSDIENLLAKLEESLANMQADSDAKIATLKAETDAAIEKLNNERVVLEAELALHKTNYDSKVSELEAADKTNTEALAALKTQYDKDLAVLNKADEDNKTAIEALATTYNAKVAELEAADKTNTEALTALKTQYDKDLAVLNKADADNKTAIEALATTYNAKVAELEAADKTNTEALAALKTQYDKDLAVLNKADADNKTAIEALTTTYNAKVAELEAADTANETALATLRAEYEQTFAELIDNDNAIISALDELITAYNESMEILYANDVALENALNALIEQYEIEINALYEASENNAAAIEALTTNYNNKVKELEAADKANTEALADLKTQYNKDLADLKAADATNKTAIDTLTTNYNNKVKELEDADKANTEALTALKTQYNKDLADLKAADATNKTAIDTLTTNYNNKVKELEDADKATDEALAALKTQYNKDLADLKAADATNKTAIDTLTTNYNNKVKELEDADKATDEALAALKTQYNKDLADLKAADATNKTAIDTLTTNYNNKVKELEDADAKITQNLTTLKTNYEAKIAEINSKISTIESTIAQNKLELQTSINNLSSSHASDVAAINILIEALKEADTAAELRIIELEAKMAGLLSAFTVTFDTNGGSEVIAAQSVNRGEKVTKPADPTREGYDFLGWYVGDEEWSFIGYGVTEDITLTAKWEVSYNYIVVNDEVTITSYIGTRNVVNIPSEINGYPVTGIGEMAFVYDTNITDVTIPDSVTFIGSAAFGYCINLRNITIGNGVTSIGYSAFASCTKLTSVAIPDGVTSIDSSAFYQCSSLTSVVIPNSVTSIGRGAFEGCSSLTSVVIPDSVTSIGNYAFYGCTHIIEVEDGISYVDTWAVGFDKSTANAVLRNGTVGIADSTFYYSSITSITMPDSVTYIGEDAFYECRNLTNVYITDIAKWCGFTFDDYYSNPVYYADNLYLNGELLTDLIIPDGVTYIGDYTFAGCTSLTSVTISDSVTSIGDYAFAECGNIVSITFAENSQLDSIGNDAFSWCYNLRNITIPNSVTYIDNYAFNSCYNLRNIFYGGTEEKWAEIGININSFYYSPTIYYYSNVEPTTEGAYWHYVDGVPTPWCCLVHNAVKMNAISAGCHQNGQIEYWYCGDCGLAFADRGLTQRIDKNDIEVPYTAEIIHVNAVEAGCHQNGNEEYWYCEECYAVFADAELTRLSNRKNFITPCIADIIHVDAVAPTCLKAGNLEYWYCAECDAVFTDAALTRLSNRKNVTTICSSDIVKVEAVDPACHQNGYLEHWYCEDCGLAFADEALTQTIDRNTVTRPYYAGIIHVDAIEASCHQNGNVEYWYCLDCDAVFTDAALTRLSNRKNVITPYTANITHVYAVEATCHQNGNIEYWYCEDCDAVFTDAALTRLSNRKNVITPYTANITHVYAVEATCHQNGNVEYWYCEDCDAVFTDAALTKLSNRKNVITPYHAEITHVDAIEAGCHQDGNVEYWYCEDCDAVFTDAELTRLSNRKNVITPYYAEITHVDAVEATCHQDGNLELWYCSECYAVFADAELTQLTNIYRAIIPHYSDIIYTEMIYPTCTSTGLTEGAYCSECGEVILEQEEIPALGHELETYIIIYEATCTDYGLNRLCCNRCDYFTEEVIPASGHTTGFLYGHGPTCTEHGLTEGIQCSKCGEMIVEQEEIPPLGHTNETCTVNVITSATCTEPGLNEWICNYCDYYAEEVIPAHHNYVDGNCTYCYITNPDYFSFYLLSNGTYEISAKDVNNMPAVVNIPSEHNGIAVTAIGEEAFEWCESITSITIPDSVTYIGDWAFSWCSKLENVHIGTGIKNIGCAAFFCCSSISAVHIKDLTAWCNISFEEGVGSNPLEANYDTISCGSNLYLNGNLVSDLVIPDEITEINNDTFIYCSSLTSVTIPHSVTSIGDYAFEGCSSLTSIVIPDSVTTIGDRAFYGCSSLISVVIPDSVTSIGRYAFEGCSNLTIYCEAESKPSGWDSNWNYSYCPVVWGYIDWSKVYEYTNNGDSITINKYIGTDTVVEIPSEIDGLPVTSIGYPGFNQITNITIPDSIIYINGSAFNGCPNLEYNEYDNALYLGNNENPYLALIKAKDTSITSCNINDNTKIIASDAFEFCSNLTSITIPNSVTSIGNCAFLHCGFKSIIIPDNVTHMSSNAFWGCYNITIYCEAESKPDNWAYDWNDTAPMEEPNVYLPVVWGYIDWSNVYEYTNNGDSITINKYIGTDTEVEIPSKIDGLPVTAIADYAFVWCSSLTSIVIPDRVTSIGWYAFYGCSSLASVVIGDSVTSIGYYAFSGCSSLTSVVIGDSVTSIGYSAFSYCSSLTSVVIGDSVTSIGDVAFMACHNLLSVTSHIAIDDFVFFRSDKVVIYREETQPNNWTPSGIPVVWDCNNNDVADDGYIYAIIDGIRYGLKNGNAAVVGQPHNITEISIPSSIVYKGLEYSVTSISSGAFSACYSLVSISIPSSVTTISETAFGYYDIDDGDIIGCNNLTNITVSSSNPNYQSIDGILYSKDGKTLIQYPAAKSGPAFTIPDSVTHISSHAFYHSKLISITISDNVTDIGGYAFFGCATLETIYFNATNANDLNDQSNVFAKVGIQSNRVKVVIGNNVTKIPSYLFNTYDPVYSSNTPMITSVEFEKGCVCTSIGYRAFSGCSSLTSVIIPHSVTSVGEDAFYGCSNLTIYCEAESQPSGWDSNWNYSDCPVVWGYVKPDWSKVYEYTNNGDSITIDKYIGTDTVVEIPSEIDGVPVTVIGDEAFYWCESLTSVAIPDSVTSIGDCAFNGCSNLENIYIGIGVRKIGWAAFLNCPSITAVHIKDLTAWCNISFGSNPLQANCDTQSWGSNLYLNGNLVSNLVIPYGVTKINSDTFTYCSSLTSIIIPNSVTSIGNSAFSNCSSLTSVIIPHSVTSIGWYAFYGCSNLTIYCEAESQPSGWDSNWNSSNCPVVWGYSTGTSFEKAYVIKSGQSHNAVIDTAGEYVYFVFTATESKTYTFQSDGSYDTYGYLYDFNQSPISNNDDDGSELNFLISRSLSAGETVYIGVRLYSQYDTGTFTVSVS